MAQNIQSLMYQITEGPTIHVGTEDVFQLRQLIAYDSDVIAQNFDRFNVAMDCLITSIQDNFHVIGGVDFSQESKRLLELAALFSAHQAEDLRYYVDQLQQ